jgi:hypothetical protein
MSKKGKMNFSKKKFVIVKCVSCKSSHVKWLKLRVGYQ